jgi:hypothetical protein
MNFLLVEKSRASLRFTTCNINKIKKIKTQESGQGLRLRGCSKITCQFSFVVYNKRLCMVIDASGEALEMDKI